MSFKLPSSSIKASRSPLRPRLLSLIGSRRDLRVSTLPEKATWERKWAELIAKLKTMEEEIIKKYKSTLQLLKVLLYYRRRRAHSKALDEQQDCGDHHAKDG